MNIENIKAFLEVASTGNFRKAAENMNITQSTMSSRIKNLEQSINRQLFQRNRNGTELTTGGKSFFRHAVTVVKTWELAQMEVSLPGKQDTVVGLGIQLNHWRDFTVKWLQWMHDYAPNVATQVRSDYSFLLMNQLQNGLLDVAIVYDPVKSPEVEIESYKTEKLILVSTKPRVLEKGYIDDYIFVDWGDTFRANHSRIYPDANYHRLMLEVSTIAFNHILVHGGSGYFMEKDVLPYIKEQTLYRVKGAVEMFLTLFMAYNIDRRDDDSVQKAIRGLTAIK